MKVCTRVRSRNRKNLAEASTELSLYLLLLLLVQTIERYYLPFGSFPIEYKRVDCRCCYTSSSIAFLPQTTRIAIQYNDGACLPASLPVRPHGNGPQTVDTPIETTSNENCYIYVCNIQYYNLPTTTTTTTTTRKDSSRYEKGDSNLPITTSRSYKGKLDSVIKCNGTLSA